jgi:nicotinamidase-related amidase
MNTQMLIIDPQVDFHDLPGSMLPVMGASADSHRLSALINRKQRAISDIHITLDTHQLLDVAHPLMWVNSQGRRPVPFTIITADDVRKGVWRAFNPAYQKRVGSYVDQLEVNGRYPLSIWPPHCLVGTPGHNVVAPVREAVTDWEERRSRRVDYVTKGLNPWTEHYSAVMADVPDASDPTTQLNTRLIRTLEQADVILLSGQALSHCVANTVRDIAANFGADSIRKMVLIEDTSSAVGGFENLAADFMRDMKVRGMQTAKAADIDI